MLPLMLLSAFPLPREHSLSPSAPATSRELAFKPLLQLHCPFAQSAQLLQGERTSHLPFLYLVLSDTNMRHKKARIEKQQLGSERWYSE